MTAVQDSQLLTEMKHLLPHLKVTKEDILNPKPEFVASFCECFLDFYESKIGDIVGAGEKCLASNIDTAHVQSEFGPHIALFTRIKHIILKNKIINKELFCITDFLMPNKQRTKTFLTCMISYMLYVDGKVECARGIIEKCKELEKRAEEIVQTRNYLLEDINRTAKECANLEPKLQHLRSNLIVVNNEYEQMLKQKQEKDAHDKEGKTELLKYESVLENKKEVLDYVLAEQKSLQQKIVSPEEFSSLNEMMEQLKEQEDEATKLEQHRASDLANKRKYCAYSNEIVESLNGLDLNCFEILKELKEERTNMKKSEQEYASLARDIDMYEKETFKIKAEIEALEERKLQLSMQREKLKRDIQKNINNQKVKNSASVMELKELEEEYQNLGGRIKTYEELLKQCNRDRDLLNDKFNEQYKIALDTESKKVMEFRQALDDMQDELDYN